MGWGFYCIFERVISVFVLETGRRTGGKGVGVESEGVSELDG